MTNHVEARNVAKTLRFDAHLSEQGIKEAEAGGKALKDLGYQFDIAHTSLLSRAQETLKRVRNTDKKLGFFSLLRSFAFFIDHKVLEQIGQSDLSVEKTWRLNERHYGALTGLNKAETAAKHGEDQVIHAMPSYVIRPHDPVALVGQDLAPLLRHPATCHGKGPPVLRHHRQ